MKKVNILFVFLLVITVLSACDNSDEENTEEENKEAKAEKMEDSVWNNIKEAEGMVVGTSGTLIAASYFDDDEEKEEQLTGYDVELMRKVAKRLDLDISFEIIGVGAFPDFNIYLHPTLKFHPTEQAVVLQKEADVLKDKINEVLNEMREDGTITDLAVKFYDEDASKEPEDDIKVIEGLDL